MTAIITTERDRSLFAPQYAELPTGALPSHPYWSQDYYDREVETIFKKTWMLAGNIVDLKERNSYFVINVEACKASILVCHGADGKIRAFHNSCPHRGTALVADSKGKSRLFRCVYHNWIFENEGRLRGIPDESMFIDLDKSQCDLAQIHCEVWNGLIFVSLAQERPSPIAEWLGTFGHRFANYPFEKYTSRVEWQIELKANWKICMEASQEVYHVTALHGGSFGQLLATGDNRVSRSPHIELLGLHRQMTSLSAGISFELKPAAKAAARFGAAGTVRTQAVAAPPGCNPSGAENWAVDTVGLFPNSCILFVGDGFITYTSWPMSVDRTRFVARRYYQPAASAGGRFAQEYSKAFVRNVFVEDCGPIEMVQKGLESSRRDVIFSDQELACRHQYATVDDYVNGRRKSS